MQVSWWFRSRSKRARGVGHLPVSERDWKGKAEDRDTMCDRPGERVRHWVRLGMHCRCNLSELYLTGRTWYLWDEQQQFSFVAGLRTVRHLAGEHGKEIYLNVLDSRSQQCVTATFIGRQYCP